MTPTFGARLTSTFATAGRLCVGIDPHAYLLGQWGLSDDARGAREFGLRVVEATVGRAGIVKPQVAFFERHGSAGYAALEAVLGAARDAGLIVIADVKRGDVGTSVAAYGEAWLTPGSPLESDAMTISAFQGVGSIQAPHDLATAHGKGLFVLAATSNPEAATLQTATVTAGPTAGTSVAASIVADVHDWNQLETGLGSTGVVIGATVALGDYGITPRSLAGTPILAPGFGHQGALVSDVGTLFGGASSGVIVSASRSILAAGPSGIDAAIGAQSAEIAGVFA
ncbi:orotidine-5'-phosphate decarboxylase [Conyzicola nivalis]|uniref:Orotidine-5'-phosphate decarboxylase n=1 Tax=Conyzicola nivalis TaxID=1477021 RepID=A0A916SER4_9MICO|nr:orotidine-5'-phosphate decarboxylase [Conyzicola nivalis]GGA96442.1 orotidine 5'-phosphate decarboxylase [Conyzicola nivalis]